MTTPPDRDDPTDAARPGEDHEVPDDGMAPLVSNTGDDEDGAPTG